MILKDEGIDPVYGTCSGCEIETNGSCHPDRCVFSHGPDEVRWYEIDIEIGVPGREG